MINFSPRYPLLPPEKFEKELKKHGNIEKFFASTFERGDEGFRLRSDIWNNIVALKRLDFIERILEQQNVTSTGMLHSIFRAAALIGTTSSVQLALDGFRKDPLTNDEYKRRRYLELSHYFSANTDFNTFLQAIGQYSNHPNLKLTLLNWLSDLILSEKVDTDAFISNKDKLEPLIQTGETLWEGFSSQFFPIQEIEKEPFKIELTDSVGSGAFGPVYPIFHNNFDKKMIWNEALQNQRPKKLSKSIQYLLCELDDDIYTGKEKLDDWMQGEVYDISDFSHLNDEQLLISLPIKYFFNYCQYNQDTGYWHSSSSKQNFLNSQVSLEELSATNVFKVVFDIAICPNALTSFRIGSIARVKTWNFLAQVLNEDPRDRAKVQKSVKECSWYRYDHKDAYKDLTKFLIICINRKKNTATILNYCYND